MLKSLKRASLSKKITKITVTLFLVIFSSSTIIAYYDITHLLLNNEKDKISHTIEVIRSYLSDKENLSIQSLLEGEDSTNRIINVGTKQYILETNGVLVNSIYSGQDIAVFDSHKQLLLMTAKYVEGIKVGIYDKIEDYQIGKFEGYYKTEKVYPAGSGELIGYVMVFNRLDSYYVARRYLVIRLFLIEFAGASLSVLAVLILTRRLIKPLGDFHKVIKDIADNPSDLHVRSNIRTGDEIEDLSIIFDDMLDRVENYTKRQAQFIGDISHELRTPVAVIKGHIGLLKRWGKDDPEILQKSLDSTYNEVVRMSVMINDMLDMVRVQDSFELHRGKTTDLKQSIETAIANFKVLHPDCYFQFVTSVKQTIFGEIYKNHFEQLLLILMDNGIKYSPNRKFIMISLKTVGRTAILKVKDGGEGISTEDLDHIFERFYRTDKSRHRMTTQSGLGIGLSILKQIVDAYELKIEVNSQVGEGTEFTLTIPLSDKNDKTD